MSTRGVCPTPAAGARVEEEAPHGEAEEMRRRAGRGEEAMRRRCGGVRGEERRGGEAEKMRAEAKEMRRRAGGGGEAEGRGERRRGEASGLAVGMRGEEASVAVPCQGRVMGQAGGPWPARPFVPCRHGHAAGRGPCRRPMGRLYTYINEIHTHT
jgi:hypothetical protein